MDCKAHRKTRHLEIRALHFESFTFELDLVVTELVKAIKNFRVFQQCDSVSLTQATTSQVTQLVNQALLVN